MKNGGMPGKINSENLCKKGVRMKTFEEIQKANEAIITTDIKGKDYAEVNQRIKAFRMVYPEGFISTCIHKLEGGMCVMSASCGYTVRNEDGDPYKILLGSGTAYEKENSSFINKTSYIENCETSAVGRALGMAGFGIDTSVRSAEEMKNAELQQEALKPITKAQVKSVKELAKAKGSAIEDICKYYKVEKLEDMTAQQYGECLNALNMKENK